MAVHHSLIKRPLLPLHDPRLEAIDEVAETPGTNPPPSFDGRQGRGVVSGFAGKGQLIAEPLRTTVGHHGESSMPDEKARHAHETRDVNILNLISFSIGLAFLVIAGLLISWGRIPLLRRSSRVWAHRHRHLKTFGPCRRAALAGGAQKDLKQYKATEDQILNSYGWVDQKAGVVRIPIDKAMDILLQRGFPVRGLTPEKQLRRRPPGGYGESSEGGGRYNAFLIKWQGLAVEYTWVAIS